MKITSFNPLIYTNDAEEIVSLFEALGFEKRHAPIATASSGNKFTNYRLKDENGFCVDVNATAASLPKAVTTIRINVDDFDEAYQFLTDRGFKPYNGNPVSEGKSAKAVLMMSPSGFGITLIQHIKKE